MEVFAGFADAARGIAASPPLAAYAGACFAFSLLTTVRDVDIAASGRPAPTTVGALVALYAVRARNVAGWLAFSVLSAIVIACIMLPLGAALSPFALVAALLYRLYAPTVREVLRQPLPRSSSPDPA